MPESTAAREYPGAPLVGVGVIASGQGRVLLVERGRPPLAGYWSLPGGLIELGETAAEAARRETKEETGVAVRVYRVAAVFDRIERDADGRVRYHFVLIDYLAEAEAGGCPEPQAGGDARRAAWIGWEELHHYRLTPGLEEVLGEARRMQG